MFVVESLALVMCKSLDHQEVKLLKVVSVATLLLHASNQKTPTYLNSIAHCSFQTTPSLSAVAKLSWQKFSDFGREAIGREGMNTLANRLLGIGGFIRQLAICKPKVEELALSCAPNCDIHLGSNENEGLGGRTSSAISPAQQLWRSQRQPS